MPKSKSLDTFGRYVIDKKIGVGGMAEVFKAHLRSDPTQLFAIKKILSIHATNKNLISMLVHEAKVSASLKHRNIVPIHDFGRVDETYYLAMQYVEGNDLDQIIEECRRLGRSIPIEIILYVTMEVLEGLAFAHKKRDTFNQPLNIVHRDMSPHNVMLSRQGEVKVLDFGIAKAQGKAAETQAGILKGKFSYMAPEQAEGMPVDRRTDLFTVGTLLYEMVTLENPFAVEAEAEILERVRKAKYRSPSLLNRKLPKSLDKIIRKALRKKPARRYQFAEEFQADIYEVQRGGLGFAGGDEIKDFLRGCFDESSKSISLEFAPVESRPRSYEFRRPEHVTDPYIIYHRRKNRWGSLVHYVPIIALVLILFGYLGVVSIDKLHGLMSELHILRTEVSQLKGDKGNQDDATDTVSPNTPQAAKRRAITFEGDAKSTLAALAEDERKRIELSIRNEVHAHLRNHDVEESKKGRLETTSYQLRYRMDRKALRIIDFSWRSVR